MPDWCPDCHCMLPPGLEECPNCGAHLGKAGRDASQKGAENQEVFSANEIFGLSAYYIGIALIPIVIVILIGVLCVWLGGK